MYSSKNKIKKNDCRSICILLLQIICRNSIYRKWIRKRICIDCLNRVEIKKKSLCGWIKINEDEENNLCSVFQ